MIKNLAKLLLSNSHIRAYSRRVYGEIKEDIAVIPSPETSVPEATPISCRSSVMAGPRLNLLVPALSVKHVFGGIATALDIFQAMAAGIANVRIILTDESSFHSSDNPAFSDWKIGGLDDDDKPGRWIIPAGDRYGKTLCISAGDRFVASAWWTAVIIRHIRAWQGDVFSMSSPNRYVYLIQDYEPGFYPWSARYALAQSTYLESEGVIALFNTSILRSFFADEGYKFEHDFVFEPHINIKLAGFLDQVTPEIKEKRILVYGRPGVARNAFELLVMGLREWVEKDPKAKDWTIVSVGEPHANVDLGRGLQMQSLGKLSLESYAQELLRSSIGLSLMISPHPSYPPLEMAAFGLNVITNGYKAKDLSQVHPGIMGLTNISPLSISDALMRLTDNDGVAKNVTVATSSFWAEYTSKNAGYSELSSAVLELMSLKR